MRPVTDLPVPRLSVVVVSYNSSRDLAECLPRMTGPGMEVLVIDNASTDGSATAAGSVDGVLVTQLPVNVGWARGCNIGAGLARGSVLAFVNPDARPDRGQLLALAASLADPTVGSVSPAFLGADDEPQAFYFRFPDLLTGTFCVFNAGQRLDALLGSPFIRRRTYSFGQELPTAVDQPGGACLVMRTEDVRRLGGFGDDFFLFFADTDLGLRLANRGLTARVDWSVRVRHEGGGSVRQLPEGELRVHFQRDYLEYVRRREGRAALLLMKALALLLTGAAPALLRLVRGDPRDALRQLVLAAAVVR
jgi:GT2 family glycosyltransferase